MAALMILTVSFAEKQQRSCKAKKIDAEAYVHARGTDVSHMVVRELVGGGGGSAVCVANLVLLRQTLTFHGYPDGTLDRRANPASRSPATNLLFAPLTTAKSLLWRRQPFRQTLT